MSSNTQAILKQVRKGLALCREPGWNFAVNFLGVSFDEVYPEAGITSIDPGPHCVDTDGQINLTALLLLIDVGLAITMRQHAGAATRMATNNLSIQFSGGPRRDRLVNSAAIDGLVRHSAAPIYILRHSVVSGTDLVATACGSHISLGNSRGLVPVPAHQRSVTAEIDPIDLSTMTEKEAVVYERAELATAPGERSFLDRFFGIMPSKEPGGASCVVENGYHIANRVGHLQGAIGLAIASSTAVEALDASWALVAMSAFFLEGGTGSSFFAKSEILRLGRLTAAVRCRIMDSQGKVILETTSTHARIQN